jgi:hypothetical protein
MKNTYDAYFVRAERESCATEEQCECWPENHSFRSFALVVARVAGRAPRRSVAPDAWHPPTEVTCAIVRAVTQGCLIDRATLAEVDALFSARVLHSCIRRFGDSWIPRQPSAPLMQRLWSSCVPSFMDSAPLIYGSLVPMRFPTDPFGLSLSENLSLAVPPREVHNVIWRTALRIGRCPDSLYATASAWRCADDALRTPV